MKINMVYKILLLTLLIVASLVSSSFSARCGSSIPMVKLSATDQNQESLSLVDDQVLERDDIIHERLLRANTKDYGRPDPAPTYVKPPFKLIPN
ncbi:hypothetical protein L1987_78499 [Smallanthus sonchifolius]|uniref:Uncharacterized protein n=1 Tax=Smallanthus sonchifolius TaxID=185202 RepID=A0ACB8ZD25_9ASTR|nr:hypothetical protein L1987_78499 [Smallanthus sonchifolius]